MTGPGRFQLRLVGLHGVPLPGVRVVFRDVGDRNGKKGFLMFSG